MLVCRKAVGWKNARRPGMSDIRPGWPPDRTGLDGIGEDLGVDNLAASYERCRELHRRHGRTYYLATRFLPAWKRRHVHALYGFARYADEIVDRMDGTLPEQRRAALEEWAARFTAGLDGADIDDPILPAVVHTIEVFRL